MVIAKGGKSCVLKLHLRALIVSKGTIILLKIKRMTQIESSLVNTAVSVKNTHNTRKQNKNLFQAVLC